MSSSLLQSVETFEPNADIPDIRPGDTVKVHVRIVEGTTERIQVFQGVVLRMHKGRGVNGTFTVRRIASGGIGVERMFMFSSPRVEKVEVVQRAHVRRAQLYFLRDLRGKAARLKEKRY